MKRASIALLCASLCQGAAFALPYGYGDFLAQAGTLQAPLKVQTAPRAPALLAQSTSNVERSASPGTAARIAAPVASVGVQPVDLYPGEVRVLPIAGVERIAIGNGGVVTATIVDEKQVVLLGEAIGRTSMHLWLKNGTQRRFEVAVAGTNQADRAARELREILSLDPNVKVNVVNDKVILSGDYSTAESAVKVKLIATQYPQVINVVNERPLGFEAPKVQMVLMDVKVVEARKAAVDNLGIKWSTQGVAGPTVANNVLIYSNSRGRPDLTSAAGGLGPVSLARPFLSFVGMANQITSLLNFLETNGDSWTLAEPRVSTVSGGKSKVQVGGQVPVPVASGFGAVNVVYKDYGVILEISPVVDSNGNIRSKIVTEVSRPDPSTGSGGFTGFITNRTETEVSLVEGETLVISGLLQNTGSKNNEAVAGLGKIPVLGRLFSNREFTNDRTEMLVVVTPRVHQSGSAIAKAMESDALGKIEQIQGVIQNRVSE